jgi:hypothetical protein
MAAGDVPAVPSVPANPAVPDDLTFFDDLGAWAGLDPADAPAATPAGTPPGTRADNDPARPVVFANGFVLSPYAETGGPGDSLKHPPRTLWHASPGSTATPD